MEQDIILCDLDGTAALMDDRIKTREEQVLKDGSNKNKWKAFNSGIGLEPVNKPVLSVLNAMTSNGYKVVYMSGRSEIFRGKTERWLTINNFPSGQLIMRPEGNYKKDDIVKKELIKQIDIDRVLFCLDDRDQVVNMWRKELGLSCFQVNYGDF